MTPAYSVLIADDHQIVRAALRTLLARPQTQQVMPNLVIAEACDGLEAIEAVKKHQPNLLLLDVSMPLAGGTEVVLEVKRWSPETKTVIFTGITSPGTLTGLIEVGVHGLFHKSADFAVMLKQLPLILQGAHYVDEHIQQQLGVDQAESNLTRRERQILNLVISGQSNREIGTALGISPKTVDKHRSNVMAKLDVHSFAELMRYALRQGLVDEMGGV